MAHQLAGEPGSGLTLAEAYKRINIKHTSISDGDVVAAFYDVYSNVRSTSTIKALGCISEARQSQLLAFVLTIIPHLTQENVALLTTRPQLPNHIGSSGKVKVEETNGLSNSSPDNNIESEVQHPDPLVSPTVARSTSQASITSSESEIDVYSAESISTISQETTSSGIPMSEEDSADSDFDEPIGGRYWDRQSWRCEECNDELVDGKCPNGDAINPCMVCGRDFAPGACARVCDECHEVLQESCSACAQNDTLNEQGTNEEAILAWDDRDGVWRCTTCQWEVEANNEEEGQCHCLKQPKEDDCGLVYSDIDPLRPWGRYAFSDFPSQTRPKKRARRIKLLHYHEYGPADSDSSGAESVDSEPDSGDESFIEDDGPFDPALLTLQGPVWAPGEHEDTEGSDASGDNHGHGATNGSGAMDTS